MVNRLELDAQEKNELLKQQFAVAGLALDPVWQPTPGDVDLENRQLRLLWQWVEACRACPDRQRLHQRGFLYPPIEPDFDPETDWLRFERWLAGQPLSWSYAAECGELPDPAGLTDVGIRAQLDKVLGVLWEHGVSVDLFGPVPDRALYTYLCPLLATAEFEIGAPGSFWHLGCSAWCEDCFQRDWCVTRHRDCAG